LTAGAPTTINVHVPDGSGVQVFIDLEDGGQRRLAQVDNWTAPREVDGQLVGRASFAVPADLPLGWHGLRAEVESVPETARAVLAVAPAHLPAPAGRREFADRSWGLMTQLYSVRSQRSWGIGDLADLTELVSLSGDQGADFLWVNPWHAAEPDTPMTPSPYLPATRRCINPIYSRPEDIREAAYLPNTQRTLLEWGLEEISALNTDAGPIDRDRVWQAKKPALETIFATGRTRSRQQDLDRFRRAQGQGLEDFALWCAVHE